MTIITLWAGLAIFTIININKLHTNNFSYHYSNIKNA